MSNLTDMNSAVLRRMAQRHRSGGRPLGGMGDYPEILPYRVMLTQAGDGKPVDGPVSGSVTASQGGDVLSQIRDILLHLPQMMSEEWRSRFVMTPREAISFIAPGGPISVGVGAAVAVVSQQVDEMFTGFLTHVGVNVIAPAGFSSITWQIRINGAIHPKFADRIFSAPTISTPVPFTLELTQNRTLQLVAINTGAVPVDVAGILVGWTEYMATFKNYGSAPSAGIA